MSRSIRSASAIFRVVGYSVCWWWVTGSDGVRDTKSSRKICATQTERAKPH
jgi:hypothetical protein